VPRGRHGAHEVTLSPQYRNYTVATRVPEYVRGTVLGHGHVIISGALDECGREPGEAALPVITPPSSKYFRGSVIFPSMTEAATARDLPR